MKNFTPPPFTRFIFLVVMINIFLMTTTYHTVAQCFQPAVVNENGTDPGNINGTGWTGNDVKVIDEEVMRVNVWDGSYCGLGWNYFDGTTTHTGFLVIEDGADPDVSLIHNGADWFALVARSSASNQGIYLDVYKWINGPDNFQALSGNTNIQLSSNNAAYVNNVNVDADKAGNFVVIWDDANTGNIEMIGGITATNSNPALSTNGAKTIPNTAGHYLPDVCLYTNYNNTILVNYSYLSGDFTTIFVGTDLFSDLVGTSSLSNSSPFSQQHNDNLDHPRIASSTKVVGTPINQYNVWTVVAARPYQGRYDIIGHTLWNNSVVDLVYTDGSMSNNLCDIGDATYNRFPVVTYCNDPRGYIVGWSCGFTQSHEFNPYGIIALRCKYDGTYYPITIANTTYNGFLLVNSGNTDNNYEYMLSLAGRDNEHITHNVLYTFYSDMDNDILYKEVDWLAPTLRLEEELNLTLFPNPFHSNLNLKGNTNDVYTIQILDIEGRQLFLHTNTLDALNKSINEFAVNVSKGIYFCIVEDSNNRVFRTKLVKY